MTNDNFKLIIAGDMFPSNKNMDLFKKGAINELFDNKIINLFENADYSICNLEGVFTLEEKPIKKVDPIIKATPDTANIYVKLGIDCVTLANNHILDYRKKGYYDTISTLESNNIEYFGAGANKNEIKKYFQIPYSKKKIIVYTVAETMFNVPGDSYPGVNLYDEYNTALDIRNLKNNCDYLIVIYHGGTEFFWYNSELMRKRFRCMADNGADLVIAQHTHCIGIQENYNNSYLLYGQGDFLFARSVNEYKETGLILEINFGEKIEITRHLVKHNGGKVDYDKEQNFSSFDKRSVEFKNGNTFYDEYKSFSDDKLIMFLEAFRGKNLIDKVVRKILPREKYLYYLKSRYTEKQLLRIVSGIEFEEYRESVVTGLWNLIKSEQRM